MSSRVLGRMHGGFELRGQRLTEAPSAAGLGQQPPAMDFGCAATALPKRGTDEEQSWCSRRWRTIRQIGGGVNEVSSKSPGAWSALNESKCDALGAPAAPSTPHMILAAIDTSTDATHMHRTEGPYILTHRRHKHPTVRIQHTLQACRRPSTQRVSAARATQPESTAHAHSAPPVPLPYPLAVARLPGSDQLQRSVIALRAAE